MKHLYNQYYKTVLLQ